MQHDVAAQRKAAGTAAPGIALTTSNASDGSAGKRWYVVHTQPHAENRAIVNLERQGYRIFWRCGHAIYFGSVLSAFHIAGARECAERIVSLMRRHPRSAAFQIPGIWKAKIRD